MATQLSVFNDALGVLGARSLVATTDPVEPARVLTSLWDHVVKYCLEQGRWKFAEREAALTPSLVEIPTFGMANAFDKPDDYVRLNEMSADEYFISPLFFVHERGPYWYSDLEEIWIRYISDDAAYGGNLAAWPETFTTFVTLYLAVRGAPRIAPTKKVELIRIGANMDLDGAKKNALAKDAVAGPTQFLPEGRWAASRGGRTRGRNSRRSLYGS